MKMNKYFKYVGSTVLLLIVPLVILSKRLEKALPRLSEREGLTFQLPPQCGPGIKDKQTARGKQVLQLIVDRSDSPISSRVQ